MKENPRYEKFVEWVIKKAGSDTGFRAHMARADNPDTEYQSWPYLVNFGIDLALDQQRLPYTLIGAAICKAKIERDGAYGLGKALSSCMMQSDKEESQSNPRLRRLLACSSVQETCRVLRPLLALINDKATRKLSYAQLLNDLALFSLNDKRVKLRWARDFYSSESPEEARQ